jgi:uncharacterized protein YkwD
LRKVFAAALAVPVITLVVARGIGQRAGTSRLVAIAAVLALGAIFALSSTRPTPTTATPPTRTTSAIDASEFSTEIRTSSSPADPVTVSFPARMNPDSVAGLLRVSPAIAIETSWDETGSNLTISPRSAWRTNTYYTVTVEAGALEESGRPLEQRVRAAFLTRPPTTAAVSATLTAGSEATIATTFRLEFSGPVDESTLDLLVSPPVEGSLIPIAGLTRVTGGSGVSETAPAFEFVPADPLQPGTQYEVRLAPGTLDADGAPIDTSALTVLTASAPAVVRFRPRNAWADVNWSADLSVRFSEPMDRASTEAAWSVTQGSKATKLSGTFTWAEGDTVLIFDPKTVMGYSQKVTMLVGEGARSKAGLPLQGASSVSFSTAARPLPKPPPPTGGGGTSGGGGGGGGGSIGGSTWAAVESYYLGLMNCTRTGGWVTSTGGCSSPGGRNVAALWQDAGISSKVARPYAKKLAVNNLCTHFSGGGPDDRLRAAGYTSYIWAENLGCRSGDPYSAVLGSHLYFQSEKSYLGGHYVNLMNAKYDRVGIGVWVASGRVRLVVDFYHPL